MAGLLLGLGILLAGCGDRQSTAEDIATPEDTQTDRIVVGFSQVGAESDWRSANTESMKSTFTKEAGYDLIFEDGQQKQANQIRAIRTFIQQEVDYIVLAPEERKLEESTRYALNYIAESSVEKLYTFTVSDKVLAELSQIASEYRKRFMDRSFKSLEILKTLC